VLESGKTVKIEAWFVVIPAMHIANTNCQGIHASPRDKVSSLPRVSKLGFVFWDSQAVLCPCQTTEFGFDYSVVHVRYRHYRLREGHIVIIW
jgi:hypothetical protein